MCLFAPRIYKKGVYSRLLTRSSNYCGSYYLRVISSNNHMKACIALIKPRIVIYYNFVVSTENHKRVCNFFNICLTQGFFQILLTAIIVIMAYDKSFKPKNKYNHWLCIRNVENFEAWNKNFGGLSYIAMYYGRQLQAVCKINQSPYHPLVIRFASHS